MDILQRIDDLRNARNWSKNKLAKMSNLSQSTVANLYNRNYDPTIATLESLCVGLGISLSEFFNTDDEIAILSEEQKRLINEWTRLTEEQKMLFLSLIKSIQN